MSFGFVEQPQTQPKLEADKDFAEYMNVFYQMVSAHLQLAMQMKSAQKVQYYRGMLFAIKSICEVYHQLISEGYIK